ncbi:hypothetical protein [Pseudoalteromonas luteoviolacea]|uniref:hypothetical protein n=1 Tax=Pseudoalteromonas luteoviolacea TaxID=43657 RepID=UPI001B383D2E|nr:hypothetical protein [Pseudoalteromonas luteoviolacea]MBQ4837122.1 hypothetical protein [Pseudoalteromonas luteoviolacea]
MHRASEGDAYLSLNKGFFYIVNSYSPNWQGAALKLGHNSQTQRSINVSGTINTQGRDYAEYMFKNASCGEILKGDVCGIDNKGLLTDKWNEAISFVIKSTNPSFVGGDDWHEKVLKPISEQATEQERESYLKRLQEERKKVDRIAFSGQVPVNIIDAEVGAYLVPVERNGKIGVIAKSKSDLSMTEYMDSVGKVIAIGDDGRTIALVKVC